MTVVDDALLAGIAEEVYLKVVTRAGYNDESNVPEYVAFRLINAIEWASPHYEYTKQIAEYLVEGGYVLPNGTVGMIRKHFDLGY